mmetsp:Transcript_45860/g.121643  ORF Transcript_45860/g.121643 Transcript_45860/m.121643 type:complete len:320 (-) Transcript_45860:46-1005(-)
MLPILCFCTLFHWAVPLSIQAGSDRPSVAIMIVGTLRIPKQGMRGREQSNMNLIEKMTGTDEDTDAEEWERLSDSNGWDNTVQNLIEPAKRTHSVHVYVCTDRAEGQVPPQVSQVIEIALARDQEDRGAQCVSHISSAGHSYSWLVKIRPDFVFYQEFPPMTSFTQGYVYTRFRSVQGIGGLFSDHFSWNYCTPSCNGLPGNAIGYVNDDMVRVVPGGLMDLAFRHQDASVRFTATTNFTGKNWIDMPGPGWIEDSLTRFWIDRKIFTMPLACPGYPRDSKRSHYRYSKHCSGRNGTTRVPKVYCGAMAPIQTAHRAIS